MKKFITTLVLSTGFAWCAHADIIYPDGHEPYKQTEGYEVRRLGKGIANIIFAPVELPKSVFDVTHDEGVESTEAFTLGPLRGFQRAGMRLASGLKDVLDWDRTRRGTGVVPLPFREFVRQQHHFPFIIFLVPAGDFF